MPKAESFRIAFDGQGATGADGLTWHAGSPVDPAIASATYAGDPTWTAAVLELVPPLRRKAPAGKPPIVRRWVLASMHPTARGAELKLDALRHALKTRGNTYRIVDMTEV